MIRCITVTIICWVGIVILAFWGITKDRTFSSISDLEKLIIPVFILVPLVPAAAAAIFTGSHFSKPWWIRGIVASVINAGIPLSFLIGTEQFGTVQPDAFLIILVYAVIGFVIGMSATRNIPSGQYLSYSIKY